MKKLLVPIDFTTASRNAGEYAVLLAKAVGAEVQLLHVSPEPLPVSNVPESVVMATALRKEDEAGVYREMHRLKKEHDVVVSASIVSGFLGDAIAEKAEQLQAGMLVMGMKNEQNRLPGTTVLKAIRKTARPVLIVPEDARFRPLKNIVLAIDYNEALSTASLDALCGLVKTFDSFVRVLHVQPKGTDLKPSEVAKKIGTMVALSKLTYFYEHIEHDNIDQGILDFVNSHPTDLLVMIAHRHGLVDRLLHRTHTSKVSFQTKLPLLVLKSLPLHE